MAVGAAKARATLISIHALLAESDVGGAREEFAEKMISIHALLAESDRQPGLFFQVFSYFYPRSPCGERHAKRFSTLHHILISIHALLAESDVSCMLYDTSALIFLSTLSLRRATRHSNLSLDAWGFLSTLSLRRATFALWMALNRP